MAINYIWNAQPNDTITRNGVTKLGAKQRKATGDQNVVLTELRAPGRTFNERDKLTIVGHGAPNANPGRKTLGGKQPEALANLVVKGGFQKIPKIVLLMCGDEFADAVKDFAKFMRGFQYQGVVVGYLAPLVVWESGKRMATIPNPLQGMGILDSGADEETISAKGKKIVIGPNDPVD